MSTVAPLPVRLAARAVGRLAPGWLAHRAAMRFLTPDRIRVRPDAEAVLARAERMTVDGLAVYAWGEGPVALLVHGWSGRAAQMTPLVAPLLERGFRVVAFDAPAHGASAGHTCTVVDMAHALRAVAAIEAPDVMVAHSMGATATALALRDGLTVERLGLIAPAARADTWAARFATWLDLDAGVREAFLDAIERRAGAPWEAIHFFACPPEVPAFVVHDRSDRWVRVSEAEAIAHCAGAELVLTDGLGHRRILADPEVIAGVVGFVADQRRSGWARISSASPATSRVLPFESATTVMPASGATSTTLANPA